MDNLSVILKMFERNRYLQMIKKQLQEHDKIIMIYGARQVGKTTLMHMVADYLEQK